MTAAMASAPVGLEPAPAHPPADTYGRGALGSGATSAAAIAAAVALAPPARPGARGW
jgi:hypothetical protein